MPPLTSMLLQCMLGMILIKYSSIISSSVYMGMLGLYQYTTVSLKLLLYFILYRDVATDGDRLPGDGESESDGPHSSYIPHG